MVAPPQVALHEDRLHYRIAVGEAASFDVSSTTQQLASACAFLKGAPADSTGAVRMGSFGAHDVWLTRGADQWSVCVCIVPAEAQGPAPDQPSLRIHPGRNDLLHVLEAAAAGPADLPAPQSPAIPPSVDIAPRDRLRSVQPPAARRRTVILRSASDILRLMAQVATRWRLPKIIVELGALAELQRQRAQVRLTHLAGIGAVQYGGAVAASAVLLVGVADILRRHIMVVNDEPTTDAQSLERLLLVVLAALGAWLAGKMLGAVWCRARLLLALLAVWIRVLRARRRPA